MKYDRLTERYDSKTGDVYEIECVKCPMQHKCTDTDDCVNVASDRLGRLEDDIENGKLLPLKARVGDSVWVIVTCKDVETWKDHTTWYSECYLECDCYDETCESCNTDGDPHIIKTKIKGIYIEKDNRVVYMAEGIYNEYTDYAFGGNIFTSEKEALKALECLKGLIDSTVDTSDT